MSSPDLISTACRNARVLAQLCDILDGNNGARAAAIGPAAEAEAQAVGVSYAELEQYNPESSYYDPDVGPYIWDTED